jgi:hypothetical protein
MKSSIKLFLFISVTILIAACNNAELNEQIITYTQNQARLAAQKDSLLHLVLEKSMALDAKTTEYEVIVDGQAALLKENKSLQSGLSFRERQLMLAKQSNSELDKAVAGKNAINDSLMQEITILHRKIASIDKEIEQEQENNISLEQSLKQQTEARIADSIAFANKPPVQVSRPLRYINITQIGGAFGIGDTDPDFSRRIISVENISGLELTDHFIAGIGAGINFYNGGAMVPLYLDLRYRFNDRNIMPFISVDGGVMISLEQLNQSGPFLNPMFGLRKKLNNKFSLNLSTGFMCQYAPAGGRNTFFNLKGGLFFRGK